MKKRYVLKNKLRFSIILILVTIAIVSSCLVSTMYGYKEPSFKTVTVCDGDTLWTIAQKNSIKGEDIRELVYEIKEMNDLKSSVIYMGNKIKVPV